MELMKNDLSKCDIINIMIILTKWGIYTIHYAIPMKYQKYPSTTILKHADILAKVNKFS